MGYPSGVDSHSNLPRQMVIPFGIITTFTPIWDSPYRSDRSDCLLDLSDDKGTDVESSHVETRFEKSQFKPKVFKSISMFALQEPRAVIQMIILAVPLKIGGSSLWMNWLLVTCVFLCPLDQQGAMLGIPLVQSPSYSIVHGLDLTPAPRMPVSTPDFLAF